MKKLSLYITFALAGLFMSSCSEYEEWADPQSYPQEEAITIPGFKASAVEAQTLSEDAETVPVFTLSTATLPEGYELGNARVALTPQGIDGATATEVSTTIDGLASKSKIQSLIEASFGKNPVARTFTGHVYVNATKNGQAALIDAGTITYTVSTVTPDIANAYYIIGGPNDWKQSAVDRMLKFNHSETNVYDDPVFTISFKVDPANDTWFAIGDDKACDGIADDDWSKVFGTKEGNGNNASDGTAQQFDRRANLSDDGSFKVPAGAQYIRVEINMMEYTYKVTALNFAEYLYETGNNTGWGDGLALYGPNNDGKYYGAFYLKSGFKFRSNPSDWNGSLNLGNDPDNIVEGVLINAGNSKDIACTDGFYFITVDVAAMTYMLKSFNEMHIVGDALVGNSDQWGAGVVMTYNDADKTWTANGVQLEAGKSIKFKDEDGSWSGVNLGGASVDKLIQGSNDNIPVTTGGTFNIVLHLENTDRGPYAELIPV